LTDNAVDNLSSLSLGIHAQISRPPTPSTHNTSIIVAPFPQPLHPISSNISPLQLIPKLHQKNSMHAQEELDNIHISVGLQENNGRGFNHRIVADKRYRKRVLGMKKAYDKRVNLKSFEVGQVIGIIISKMYRPKFPTSHGKNNICGRIYKLISYNDGKLIKYKVRLQDHKLTDNFNSHELVSLGGGAETYPKEYDWTIDENEIDKLPGITFRSFIENSAEAAHQAASIAHSKLSVLECNDVEALCVTCEVNAPLSALQSCTGCTSMIHKESSACAQGSYLIHATGKKIYCNIYCSNVNNFFPRLPKVFDIIDANDDISSTANSDSEAIVSKSVIDLTADLKISSKKRKVSPLLSSSTDQIPASESRSSLLLSPSALPPSKKTRIKEKKNSYYEIPTEEIQNITSFIKNYIVDHQITKPIRWTDENIIGLQYSVNSWNTHIKDTTAILGRKINNYIKSHLTNPSTTPLSLLHQTIVESGSTELPHSSGIVPSKASSSSSTCKACGEQLAPENWHRCYQCKESIHGKIICNNGHKMYADDDKLYCSSACAPPELLL
jgi:hypothetical protein